MYSKADHLHPRTTWHLVKLTPFTFISHLYFLVTQRWSLWTGFTTQIQWNLSIMEPTITNISVNKPQKACKMINRKWITFSIPNFSVYQTTKVVVILRFYCSLLEGRNQCRLASTALVDSCDNHKSISCCLSVSIFWKVPCTDFSNVSSWEGRNTWTESCTHHNTH